MPEETRSAKEMLEQRIAELLSDGSMIASGALEDRTPLYSLTQFGRETRAKLIEAFLTEKSEQDAKVSPSR